MGYAMQGTLLALELDVIRSKPLCIAGKGALECRVGYGAVWPALCHLAPCGARQASLWHSLLPSGPIFASCSPFCRNGGAQASYPAFGVEAALEAGAMKALSEVHLRRLDSPDLLHRRAVTVISIDARPEEVRVHLACIRD